MNENIGTELNDAELEQAVGGYKRPIESLICTGNGGRWVNNRCIPQK